MTRCIGFVFRPALLVYNLIKWWINIHYWIEAPKIYTVKYNLSECFLKELTHYYANTPSHSASRPILLWSDTFNNLKLVTFHSPLDWSCEKKKKKNVNTNTSCNSYNWKTLKAFKSRVKMMLWSLFLGTLCSFLSQIPCSTLDLHTTNTQTINHQAFTWKEYKGLRGLAICLHP